MDRFLIADVIMKADYPAERWFWFDPPFHGGRSALLHKQPDDVWRIDLQLGRDADAEAEKRPEAVVPRIERMLGHRNFTLEWVSIYKFQCKRLQRFVHDRVIFAGDSAHQVSPFGARGANSGLQDAENLAWKLALVVTGEAPHALVASYDHERSLAADENILHSTRATDFLSPHSQAETMLRDAALHLARHADFARRMVNSGRLSTPSAYRDSPLSTEDEDSWDGGPPPGAPIPDAPLQDEAGRRSYLGEALGPGFTLLVNGGDGLPGLPADVTPIVIEADWRDCDGLVARRFALPEAGASLMRPDGHVAARFRRPDPQAIERAWRRARGGKA